MFTSTHPFTEKIFHKVSPISNKQLDKKLDLAEQMLLSWSALKVEHRISFIKNLKLLLEKEKHRLSLIITQEMGKPIKQSIAEIEKCSTLCDYVFAHAKSFLADNIPTHAPKGSYVTYQALGPLLGIMPWNFPFWQVFRFALPALAGGNTVLIKHAPNVMLCASELEKIFIKAGFRKGIYQNLPISLNQTQKAITDTRIKAVSLTGSVQAGKAVARLAGQYLKKTVLELGGSDPYLILDSADIKTASTHCVASRMNNNGQSCISAKRWIVSKKQAKKFFQLAIEKMKLYQMQNPEEEDCNLGPLARKDLRDKLHQQVNTLKRNGAKCLLGGTKPRRNGYFYPPTILTCDASAKASSFKQELFGPVALVILTSNEKQSLKIANSNPYGLGSAVFSKSKKKAQQAAYLLEAGSCGINTAVHSHPALPFGGIKNSGYGKELSCLGFYEFVNIKTIFANP